MNRNFAFDQNVARFGPREDVASASPELGWAAFHFNPPGEIQLY